MLYYVWWKGCSPESRIKELCLNVKAAFHFEKPSALLLRENSETFFFLALQHNSNSPCGETLHTLLHTPVHNTRLPSVSFRCPVRRRQALRVRGRSTGMILIVPLSLNIVSVAQWAAETFLHTRAATATQHGDGEGAEAATAHAHAARHTKRERVEWRPRANCSSGSDWAAITNEWLVGWRLVCFQGECFPVGG